MDRVVDNLDSFWRTAFAKSASACEVLPPERSWVSSVERERGPCGLPVDAQTGAFYCPSSAVDGRDGAIAVGMRWMFERIYQRFGDRADFAVASVLAHEMGHHIQDVLGILRDGGPRVCCQLLSLNIELHADCLAGTWAYSLYDRDEIDLETMEQAVRAAQAAGDAPDTDPTDPQAHGSPAQRQHWFETGFETGRASACDPALAVRP